MTAVPELGRFITERQDRPRAGSRQRCGRAARAGSTNTSPPTIPAKEKAASLKDEYGRRALPCCICLAKAMKIIVTFAHAEKARLRQCGAELDEGLPRDLTAHSEGPLPLPKEKGVLRTASAGKEAERELPTTGAD